MQKTLAEFPAKSHFSQDLGSLMVVEFKLFGRRFLVKGPECLWRRFTEDHVFESPAERSSNPRVVTTSPVLPEQSIKIF